jgi:metal-responsive CopG/Arc/MetJ family transcriptional regulator
MESINLKLEPGLLNTIDNSLEKFNYSTRTEFIRDAIRTKLTELEKEEAIRKLTGLKGSLKGKARMSEEEARKQAGREMAAKFGIKLD